MNHIIWETFKRNIVKSPNSIIYTNILMNIYLKFIISFTYLNPFLNGRGLLFQAAPRKKVPTVPQDYHEPQVLISSTRSWPKECVGRQLVSTTSTLKKQFLFKSSHMFREVIDDFTKLHTCTNLPRKDNKLQSFTIRDIQNVHDMDRSAVRTLSKDTCLILIIII